MSESLAVVVPVKGFHLAKQRLAPHLDPEERAALAQAMATTVIAAARTLDVCVVTDDPAVRAWAAKLGVEVIDDPGGGLNAAVTHARSVLAPRFERMLIAHADLPRATDLRGIDAGGVTIVPDRRRSGTNVLCVPTNAVFEFQYGVDSYPLHHTEALRCGLVTTTHFDVDLALDVDHPEDLAEANGAAGV